MKKLCAFAMATALMFQTAFSVQASSVFADIDTVPWTGAAAIMEQAYSYGLLNGYVIDGVRYAKPNASLAYSEAVQLAYSIMKVYTGEEVNSTVTAKWLQIMTAYEIPTWLQPAASYCLEEGFLDPINLGKLKNDTYKITREEVGILFGKALTSVFSTGTNTSLSYSDLDLIQQSSYPYLALLYEKGVMTGDAAGTFRPNDQINRAEIAVVTVNAFETLYKAQLAETPATGSIAGVVTALETLSNGDIFISVFDSNSNVSKNFTVSLTNSKVTYNGVVTSLSQINVGDTVALYYTGNEAASVAITNSTAGIEQKYVYELSALTSSKITVIDSSGDKFNYNLNDDVVIYIDNTSSNLSTLMSLAEYNDYIVTLNIESNDSVTRIEAVNSVNGPLSGDLYYVSNSKIILQIGTKKYEYVLDSGVEVTYDGNDYTLDSLRAEYNTANAVVTLKLNTQGYVSSIDITSMDDETHGTLDYMNTRSLKLIARGETYAYMIDSDAKAYLDGQACEVTDISTTYKSNPYYVSLTLNRDNDIVILEAVTKNAANSAGTIIDLTDTTIEIYNSGFAYEFNIENKNYTEVEIDGKDASFAELKDNFDDYDVSVQLSFNADGEVTKISGTNEDAYFGTLKNIITSTERITITAIGVDYTYDVEPDVDIEVNDESVANIYDLDDIFEEALWSNKTITVVLDLSSGGYVHGIYVTTNGGVVEDVEDSITGTVTGEYYSHSSKYLIVYSDSSTTTYDFVVTDYEGYLTLNGKSVTVDDFEDVLDDYSIYDDELLKLILHVDSDDNIIKVEAYNTEVKVTKGYLNLVNTRYDYIEIIGKNGINSRWEVDSSCNVYYDMFNNSYSKYDYDNDFDGFISLYYDVDDNDDRIYVEVEIDKNGRVIIIDAEVV